jgi:3-deoxy-D-manno-octulosonic-acid transferase
MFRYIYYLVALIIYILVTPYLIFKSFQKKYKKAIPAKFFLVNNPKFQKNGIWFHSCSMGETNALKPILQSLNKDDINLSVSTNTGFAQGISMEINTRYLPFEIFLPFWITKQKILLVMEAELWYMLFLVASLKKTKTVLINARINDKSYKSYKRWSFLYKQIFKYIDKIFTQTQLDKQRLQELGAKNIQVIGNIKLATLPKITKKLQKPKNTLTTAGSTHKNEETIILNSWDKSYGTLAIVPRHPERFNEVNSLILDFIKTKNYTYHKYSAQQNFTSDIVLVDAMRELNNIYAISDVVILGGSFIKTAGGHNPIEPAFFNCKLISGKTIFNQKSLFECVDNYILVNNKELKQTLADIKNIKKSSLNNTGTIKPILDEIKRDGNV